MLEVGFLVAGLLVNRTKCVLLQLLIYKINVLEICKMYVDWTQIKHSREIIDQLPLLLT